MDAKAEFGVTFGNAFFLRRARHGTGVECNADRAGIGDHPPRSVDDVIKTCAVFRHRTGDLVDEERARHTAGLRQIGERDVIVHDHHADIQPKGTGAFGRKAEVQPVACIVLDDQQATERASHREDCGQDSVNARRSEDITTDGGCQHAASDETGMGRLMAGSAARDNRDLRFVPVGSQHDADVRIAVEAAQRSSRGHEHAIDRLGDGIFAAVEELRHETLP